MSDKSMPNRWNEIKRLPRDWDGKRERTVRAYTYSPDCIAIQIRTEKGYATAILSDAQARMFAQHITDAIDGHTKAA